MRIRKQFDYIGKCLEELSSMGIEATDDILYEPFYFYVSEKLALNMKKMIPDIVINLNDTVKPFQATFKKSGAVADFSFFLGKDIFNDPIDISTHIWPPKGFEFQKEEDRVAVPDKLKSLFPNLYFQKWTVSVSQDIFFEKVPEIFKTILDNEELFSGKMAHC